MVDLLAILAGNAEASRVSALADGEHDSPCAVGAISGLHVEHPVPGAGGRFDRLARPDVEAVLVHDLLPARHEVLFARAVEPEFSLRRFRVRFRVDPLLLREVLDRVRDLPLLQEQVGEPAFLGLERGVQSGGAGARDDEIEDTVLPPLAVGQRGDVRDHLLALRHGELDDGCAGEIADHVQVLDVGLVVRANLGAAVRHVRRREKRVEPLLHTI